MIRPVAGGGRPARRQTGVSQRGQAGFQRSRPPDTPHLTIGTTPPGARASRPHAVPSVAAQFPCDVAADRPAGGNRMGPAEAEAGRRCRLIPVEEMAEAAGGFVRAGRPRSRGASSHDRVTPTGQKCRSILAPVVVEGGPSVLVPIRVHWWFVFKNYLQFLPRVIHPPGPNPPTAPRPVPGRSGLPFPVCRAGSRACAGCA